MKTEKQINEQREKAKLAISKLSIQSKAELAAAWKLKGFPVESDDEFITAYIANMMGSFNYIKTIFTLAFAGLCLYFAIKALITYMSL